MSTLYKNSYGQTFRTSEGGWQFRGQMVITGQGKQVVCNPRDLTAELAKLGLTIHPNQKADEVINGEELAKLVEAIQSPKFQHARFRNQQTGGFDMVYIYHREPASPSGVQLAASGYASIVDPLLRQLRNNSALSPTEGLGGR